jgi:dipeptidyl aminopeptidase/acylaminoacyl peptidase
MCSPKILSRFSFLDLPGVVSALLLAALFLLAQNTLVQAQAIQNKIAFSREGELWTMNGDGSGQASLGLSPAMQAHDPAWSPDGKKLAFTSGYEHPIIYVANADGTNSLQLTNGRSNQPAWSPDGKKIAFTFYGAGEPQVYLMNPDGSNQQPLFINDPTIISSTSAAWSPDGARIAFVGVSSADPESYSYNIYTMKADGSEPPVLVTMGVPLENGLAWSPDGTKLAHIRLIGESTIHVVNIDGTPSGIAPLTDGEQNFSPAWSPDGSQLAFFREYVFNDENGDPVSRQKGLYVLQVSTGVVTSLNATNGETPAYRPALLQPEPTPGPAERIQKLIKKVESFGLPFGTTNSLTVKLRHALEALNVGDTATACDNLAAFINQASAQSGKKLTTQQSAEIRAEAASIRTVLGCQ